MYRSDFEKKKSIVFFIKKFELTGNQFIYTKNVKHNLRESQHFYRNRYYVANKCDIFESNHDVQYFHPACRYKKHS